MGMELKKIMDTYGTDALYYPDDLAKAMRDAGISEKETLSVMLILKCCPSVVETLTHSEVGEGEANTLLNAVVRQTGLTIDAARHILGKLMSACGVKAPWFPPLRLCKYANSNEYRVATEADQEVDQLIAKLEDGDNSAELLSALDELARGGSALAAYAMGMYYRDIDLEENTSISAKYFQTAAALGYGPAHGALADLHMRGKRISITKAVGHFQRPTAISGAHGRTWLSLSQQLLEYRQENEKRINSSLLIQGIVLVLSLLMVTLLGIEPGFWKTVAILLQGAGLAWTLVCRFFKPYHSMGIPCSLMMASWLILVLIGI